MAEDRKEVRAKLEELSGERAVYTRMPRCAFILRGIAVEKNGEVTTEENPDMELIGKLIESGLISGEIREEETVTAGEAEDVGTGISEEAGQERTEEQEDGAEDHDAQEVKPSISFPMDSHRPESIINLVNTMYAKGSLISKATGGEFGATKELAEELREGRFIRTEDAVSAVREDGGLKGLSFGDGKVTFDGFPATADPEVVRAWTALAAAVNKACIRQKHVRAARTDETNEKFAFRTWLTRLGMNGSDMKDERAVLYRNLSGHTAFRTEADAKKWAERQQEKREELRRQKEAALNQAEGAGE